MKNETTIQDAASTLQGGLPPRPNVILILIDDMGWMDLSCQGSTFYETPNIDRLAAEGMRFTNGYAACPVCSPTRASLMSGKYPARIGLTHYIGEVELYDLENDINEQHNLAEQHPERVKELLNELHDWLAEVNAITPVPNSDWKPWCNADLNPLD